jgi:hypothetical protein
MSGAAPAPLVPAKAGTQGPKDWLPAFAGTSGRMVTP